MEAKYFPEKNIGVTERLQKIGETATNYKDNFASYFKDLDVEIKDWHFSVGKKEETYNIRQLICVSAKTLFFENATLYILNLM